MLCVQELAADRPTMTEVAFMLSNHDTILPSPNQPAFIFKQLNCGRNCDVGSRNEEAITILHAR
ncbi:putative non-specific serine/threonine protein kinase [Helianthus anomalus]